MTYVDIDSLLRRVYGKRKQGASFGHAKVGGYPVRLRGLSPLAATLSTPIAAPVVAGMRLRKGSAFAPLRRRGVAALRRCAQFDLVFLLVKAYDTRWACELIKPYVKPGGVVVGLQNGITVDDMADMLGPARTLGAVVEICAAMYVPGVVERLTPASESWFALGGLTPEAQERAPEVAEILRHAGVVEVVHDIRSAKWMKLAVNAAELVPSAIVNPPLLQAAKLSGMHDFMISTGKAAMRTAIGLGHRVVAIFGIDTKDPQDPEGFVDVMLDAVYKKWSGPDTRTTVLQDWVKGRHCEVNEVNGLVVSSTKVLGGQCPANSRTVEIAHQMVHRTRRRWPCPICRARCHRPGCRHRSGTLRATREPAGQRAKPSGKRVVPTSTAKSASDPPITVRRSR